MADSEQSEEVIDCAACFVALKERQGGNLMKASSVKVRRSNIPDSADIDLSRQCNVESQINDFYFFTGERDRDRILQTLTQQGIVVQCTLYDCSSVYCSGENAETEIPRRELGQSSQLPFPLKCL